MLKRPVEDDVADPAYEDSLLKTSFSSLRLFTPEKGETRGLTDADEDAEEVLQMSRGLTDATGPTRWLVWPTAWCDAGLDTCVAVALVAAPPMRGR